MTILNEGLQETAEPEVLAAGEEFEAERVVTLAVAHGSNDMYFAFLPPLLPLLIEKLAMSKAEAGLLSVFYQAPALLQPFIGNLGDRVNLRYLIILAPAISAAMISLVGIAPNYGITALLLLFAGFSTAGLHSIAPAMVSGFSGKRLGKGMSIFMVGGELSFAVGPLVLVVAINQLTLNGLPWVMLFGVLVSVILFFRIKDAPGWQAPIGRGLPWRDALPRLRVVMLPLLAMTFLMGFLNANISTFLPTFLNSEGASLALGGISFSIIEFAGTASTLLSGWLSDRMGRRIILVVSSIATPIFALGFLAVRGWLQIPFLVAIGFAAFCVNPVLMAMVQENFPDNRALANGAYMAISFVVRSAVVVLVGALADTFGMRPVFTASIFVSLLAVPFIFMLPQR